MRKRLRKKKHLGEYTEWGVRVTIRRNRQEGFEAFLDGFLLQAVEGNGCYFGGGGGGHEFEGIIELGKVSEGPSERLQKITAWLGAREDVQHFEVGRMVDLWYDRVEA